MPFSKNTL